MNEKEYALNTTQNMQLMHRVFGALLSWSEQNKDVS